MAKKTHGKNNLHKMLQLMPSVPGMSTIATDNEVNPMLEMEKKSKNKIKRPAINSTKKGGGYGWV